MKRILYCITLVLFLGAVYVMADDGGICPPPPPGMHLAWASMYTESYQSESWCADECYQAVEPFHLTKDAQCQYIQGFDWLWYCCYWSNLNYE